MDKTRIATPVRFGKLYKAIKDYADEHCEGNFSMAVRKLVKKGLENE